MLFSRRLLLAVPVAALSLAGAAGYPDRPAKIIVPFASGGCTDIVARALTEGLAPALGQTVLVDNRPGIGTEAVAKAAREGYTVLIATFAHAVNPSVQPRLLAGWRGATAGDAPALVDTVLAFARMAEALGERLVEAEINPVFVGRAGEGVHAVDGLAVLRQV
jgi:Tripartite tricarboxylate transporter family receptor